MGSGISGLSAAYYLSDQHEVDLFEKDSRLGGHTHTHTLELENKIRVDSGFIVMNDRNYPLLTKLFLELEIELHPTSMSFSVDTENISWCSEEFKKFRFFNSLKKIRIFLEMVRFNNIASNVDSNGSIEDWLKEKKFSEFFKKNYVYPMSASIWSSSQESISRFPMKSFSRFFNNHGLLDLIKRPQWFSVLGGSNTYIEKLINQSKINNIFKNSNISIKREKEKVFVLNNDIENQYDVIIFACHANQVGAIVDDMSSEEQEILSMFEYTANNALLHHDQNLMPNEKSLWSSWNSFKDNKYDYVSYWMNNLQKLDIDRDIFVTLGNYPDVDEEKVFKKIKYEHPLYSEQTIKGQKLIRSIQGNRKTYFTGAHLGYGFHEDGIKSSLEVIKIING
ncbi:NAD(P)-binding protein [Pseudomonadota bacterium]|nr:NAD(P)-binding protein [Pseudomonadota bacterium]